MSLFLKSDSTCDILTWIFFFPQMIGLIQKLMLKQRKELTVNLVTLVSRSLMSQILFIIYAPRSKLIWNAE